MTLADVPAWLRRDLVADPESGCWEWQGRRSRDGYGVVRRPGGWRTVHRLVWLSTGRVIPRGHDLDHRCRNRACARPGHLRPVPAARNRGPLRGAPVGSLR